MVLSGKLLSIAIITLALWFALLCRICWRMLHKPARSGRLKIRERITVAGIGFATVAVGSLLVLHLTWVSATVSQHLSILATKVIFMFVLWPTLAGLLFNVAGSGKIKYLGIGTSLVTGLWCFGLFIEGAISMGASIARHPIEFLIPEGYVGWVEVKYGELNTPALRLNKGTFIFEIPDSGVVSTSSPLEEGWAQDEYFYYSKDGSVHPLNETGWGLGGMIWGGTDEWQQTTAESKPRQVDAYFYVGTEVQYHHAVSNNEIRPFRESKNDEVVH
jgi:hypothetical protein